MATQPLPLNDRPYRARQRSIVWPMILIGFGLLFLAQNMGLVHGDIWWSLWQLWPLLLVAIGVDLIFNRTIWGGLIGAGLVLALGAALVLGVTFVGEAPYYTLRGVSNSAYVPAGVEQFSQELGPTRQATFDLRHGAGQLSVSALPADSGRLIQADLARPENGAIQHNVDRNNDRATVVLRDRYEPGINIGPGRAPLDWSVQLSPLVAADLRIENGAGGIDADLRYLDVKSANISTGAGSARVTVPQEGKSSLVVKAGAASVDVTVPEGVAARITVKNGIGSVSVDQGRFPKVGNNTYQSSDYGTASNHAEITIESGISSVTVR